MEAYNKNGKWSTCHLSNKILEVPIVSDYKGNLYNKDSILEYLLDPESISSNQQLLVEHIKSLKDVVELKLQKSSQGKEFICPITGNLFGTNGIRYCYLIKCRDAFAEKCLKEVSDNNHTCPVCNEKYEDEDVIILNPTSKDDKFNLEQRMINLSSRNLTHSLKKAKKHKRKSDEKTSQTSKKVKV